MSEENYPVDHQDEAEQREERRRKANRLVFDPKATEVPGADAALAQLETTDQCLDPAIEIARLRQQLAAADRELTSRLLREGPVRSVSDLHLGGVAYEPLSSHAVAARAESRYMHFTAAELEAAIEAGREPHPRKNHVLCRDGYWTNNPKS